MKMLRPSLVLTGLLLVLCCVLYPAVVTAAARVMFADKASGSLVVGKDGQVVGSSLIGQTLDRPMEHLEYFWGRPSAASVDAATKVVVSSGSNYGPLNSALKDEVAQRVAALRATGVKGEIPGDLVTKSGSGLDPHISPAAAEVQVPRVAKARRMGEADVRAIVAANTEGSWLGLLGDARVNVLAVNLALDAKGKVAAVVSPEAAKFAPAPATP